MGGFNGNGVYVRYYNWTNDAAANIPITAPRFDTEDNGYATGLSTCLTKDGQQTLTADIPWSGFKITGYGTSSTPSARSDVPSLGQTQDSLYNWVIAGGTADALTAAYSPAITALVDGQICYARAAATNATTTPTFSPNGLTAHTITKLGGTALVAGEWVNLQELILRYNLANTRWELLNTKSTATGTSGHVLGFLDGNNTYSGTSTFSATVTMSGAAFNEAYVSSAQAVAANVLDISAIAASNIDLTETGGGTITSFGNVPAGASRKLRFTGAAPGVLTNSANLTLPNAAAITIGQNDVIEIHFVGAGAAVLDNYLPYLGAPIYGKASTGSAFTGTDTSQFVTPGSLGGNVSNANPGYQKIPGGLIIQWGVVTAVPISGTKTQSLAIAFPTACYSIVCSYQSSAPPANAPGATCTASTVTAFNGSSGATFDIAWIAVGH